MTAQHQRERSNSAPGTEVPLRGVRRPGSNIKSMAFPSLLATFPQACKAFPPSPLQAASQRESWNGAALSPRGAWIILLPRGRRRAPKSAETWQGSGAAGTASHGRRALGCNPISSRPRFSKAKQDGAGKTAVTDIPPFKRASRAARFLLLSSPRYGNSFCWQSKPRRSLHLPASRLTTSTLLRSPKPPFPTPLCLYTTPYQPLPPRLPAGCR